MAHAAGPVHDALEIGQQRRHPLYLIQDRAVRVAPQEGPQIILRLQPLVRILDRHIRLVGEGTPRQRGLAGLAWAG